MLRRLITAAAVLSCCAQPALAQCGPRDQVMTHLADRFGETRRGIGIAANNAVMELFASAESGTWTITVTMATGQTCLVASGQSFEPVSETLPPRGIPG